MTEVNINPTEGARLLAITPFTSGQLDQEIKAKLAGGQPAPPPPSGSVLWYGDFSSGTISKTLYPVQSAVAGHATVILDPLGSGQWVLNLAVADSDRPYVGATNPRADFESPPLFHPGNELWIGTQTRLPIGSGFPTSGSGWFQVAEIYGPPHGGSPTIGQDLIHDAAGWHYGLFRDSTHGYDHPWVGPPLDGKWHKLILNVRFAADNTGFVEIYYDGVQQKFSNGSTRLNYTTLQPGINWDGSSANYLIQNSYRQAGAYPGVVTLQHGPAVVDTTLEGAKAKLTL